MWIVLCIFATTENHANTHKVLWTKGTITPKTILARRDNESLVVFQSYDDEEDVEWLDEDLIEFNNEAVVYNNQEDSVQVLQKTLHDYFEPIWEY